MDLSSYHGYVRNSEMWADVSPFAGGGWSYTLRWSRKGGLLASSGVIPTVSDDGRTLSMTSEQASRIAMLLWEEH